MRGREGSAQALCEAYRYMYAYGEVTVTRSWHPEELVEAIHFRLKNIHRRLFHVDKREGNTLVLAAWWKGGRDIDTSLPVVQQFLEIFVGKDEARHSPRSFAPCDSPFASYVAPSHPVSPFLPLSPISDKLGGFAGHLGGTVVFNMIYEIFPSSSSENISQLSILMEWENPEQRRVLEGEKVEAWSLTSSQFKLFWKAVVNCRIFRTWLSRIL